MRHDSESVAGPANAAPQQADDDPRRFLPGAKRTPRAVLAGLTEGDYPAMIGANHHTIVRIVRSENLVER